MGKSVKNAMAYELDTGKKPVNPSTLGKPKIKHIKVKDNKQMTKDNYKQAKKDYRLTVAKHKQAIALAKLELKRAKLTYKIERSK